MRIQRSLNKWADNIKASTYELTTNGWLMVFSLLAFGLIIFLFTIICILISEFISLWVTWIFIAWLTYHLMFFSLLRALKNGNRKWNQHYQDYVYNAIPKSNVISNE